MLVHRMRQTLTVGLHTFAEAEAHDISCNDLECREQRFKADLRWGVFIPNYYGRPSLVGG